ncbi:MAG: hypothetical protein GC155_00855 [Alphaproteobacteria bacterium]|nr:hypothetical protein [Alphaproteobacteria bacterium]
MKAMTRAATFALALTAVAGLGALQPAYAARTAEIVNVENEKLPVATTAAKVEQAVLQSLSNRGWTILNRAPGKVDAQYARRDFSATITVTWTASAFSVMYKDSTGLSYDEGKHKIHTNYNRWVENLRTDVIRMVTNDANGVPPPQPQ